MSLQPILLPLAVGAIAGAATATKVPVPSTQQQLDNLKNAAPVAGGVMMVLSVGMTALGIMSITKPELGGKILAGVSALSLLSVLNLPAGEPSKTTGLAVGMVGLGLAASLYKGGSAARFASSEVVIGYGAMLTTSSGIFLNDLTKLLPPAATAA